MTFVFMMCIGRVWKDLLKIVGPAQKILRSEVKSARKSP